MLVLPLELDVSGAPWEGRLSRLPSKMATFRPRDAILAGWLSQARVAPTGERPLPHPALANGPIAPHSSVAVTHEECPGLGSRRSDPETEV